MEEVLSTRGLSQRYDSFDVPGWHMMSDDRDLMDWLAERDGLQLWLNGHQHAGGYGQHRGVHFFTVCGIVQAHSNAYAVVTVYPDRIQVDGCDREPSRLLAVS